MDSIIIIFWYVLMIEKRLITKIQTRQCRFIGHVIRTGQLEHLVTIGKLNGKRSKSRHREKMLDSLTSWLHTDSVTKLLDATKRDHEWKGMITYASLRDS